MIALENSERNKISVSKSTLVKGYAHTHFYPLEVTSMMHLAEIMVGKVWSPCLWKDGYRLKSNFIGASFIALDFDDGRLTLSEARKRATESGLAFILGTSKSHQKEKRTESGKVLPACDRFRLVYQAAGSAPSKEVYEYNMASVMELYPCDPSCKDAGRFFYGCKEIIDAKVGAKLPWLEIPEHLLTGEARAHVQHEKYSKYREQKIVPAWINTVLVNGYPEGGRHQICYRLGCTMIHLGFSEEEIVALCMKSPLGEIGKEEIERAVANGAERSIREYQELIQKRVGANS